MELYKSTIFCGMCNRSDAENSAPWASEIADWNYCFTAGISTLAHFLPHMTLRRSTSAPVLLAIHQSIHQPIHLSWVNFSSISDCLAIFKAENPPKALPPLAENPCQQKGVPFPSARSLASFCVPGVRGHNLDIAARSARNATGNPINLAAPALRGATVSLSGLPLRLRGRMSRYWRTI